MRGSFRYVTWLSRQWAGRYGLGGMGWYVHESRNGHINTVNHRPYDTEEAANAAMNSMSPIWESPDEE